MPSRTEPDPRYEQVRERLVERGYLRGPIERFVLRETLGGRLGSIVRSASRAALLGAPVVGAFLTGIALAVHRPILGAGDALVLWSYLSVVSFVVLFCVDALVAFLVVLGWRRGTPAPGRRVAAVLAVGLLLYLAILWWRRDPGLGPLAAAVIVVGSVIVTVVVARLARLVSLAVVLHETGDLPARGRGGVGGVVFVSVVAAAVFLIVPRTDLGRSSKGQAPSSFDPVEDGTASVLLGVDGLDGELIAALEPSGAVEPILSLFEAGTVLPVTREPGGSPPATWTTLTTGLAARQHGIVGVETERVPGVATPLRPNAGPLPIGAALRFLLPTRTAPVTGASRGVRTVWEIVGLHRPTASIGWWASWPARQARAGGYVVTDRVLVKLLEDETADRDTAPESLFVRLRADFPEQLRRWRAAFDGRFGGIASEGVREIAWESFLIDSHALSTGRLIRADAEIVLTAVYLPGLDILRRRLTAASSGEQAVIDLVAVGRAIEIYTRWLSERIAQTLEGCDRLVLMGDPGRSARAGDEGFLAVIGPGATAGCIAPAIDATAVTPTVLRVLGRPRSRAMRAPGGASCWSSVAPDPAVIETFGRRPVTSLDRPSMHDEEVLERLRSLGYVE